MKSESQQYSSPMGGFLLPYTILFLIMMLIALPDVRLSIARALDSVLYPLIGFGASYPLLTISIAGTIMVTLSSIFTNIFMDWKAQARAQEMAKHFQEELRKAKKENDAEKIKKLMKLQPKILQAQSQATSGMSKQMVLVMIFITPIFIWLMFFLQKVPYLYFTTPWADAVPFTGRNLLIISNWFLFYILFSTVIGQVFRQILKYLKVSGKWLHTSG